MVLLLTLFVSATAGAHSLDDWRLDKRAFASARVDTRIYRPGKTRIEDFPIDKQDFQNYVEQLSGKSPVVIGGVSYAIRDRGNTTGRDIARKWLAQEYAALGFTVATDNINGGQNFVAEKAGTSGKVLILSSHMDSVYNAGANDNGAGTVSALLIAKALKDISFQHTLRVVAFDREEEGLVGSRAYARQLNGSTIIGDVNLEMMAYNSKKDGRFHLIDCDRSDSNFLTTAIMTSIRGLNLPLTRMAACTERSDHASFWRNGIPAVVISENFFGGDSDICYHDDCDVADSRLDYGYAAMITRAVASAVAGLLR